MNSIFLLKSAIFGVMISSFYFEEKSTNSILLIKYFKGDNNDR